MNRKVFAWTISAVVAMACAAYVSAGGGAPGGGVPGGMGGRGGGAPGGMGGAPGGGRGGAAAPPATVPAEVAIPRPSAAEVERVNAALKRLIDSDSSPDKDLLKKYGALATVQVPRDNSAIRPTGGGRGGRGGQASSDFDIMLLGDSITSLVTVADDGGGNPGGKTAMDKYMAGTKYANFGVPGDTTQGVLGRLMGGLGQGHKPKAVMLLIGTNNNSNTAEEIAEGVGADVWELKRDFPEAKILLMGIFPRGASPTDSGRVKMAQCNKIISRLEDKKQVFFMDLTPKMLTPDGKLIGFRTTDNLHPVVEGFDIWISNAAPLLKDWAK
jgi:lysophospholipase L1-like esterase